MYIGRGALARPTELDHVTGFLGVNSSVAGLVYRVAAVGEILLLRHRVLILGTTRTSAAFSGDEDPSTLHFGAFDPADASRCVACVSCMRADVDAAPAYQVRGMAVTPELQGSGIGSALLAFVEEHLRARGQIRLLWCNARIRAVGFYERHGWHVVGGVFEIEGVGAHRRLIKRFP